MSSRDKLTPLGTRCASCPMIRLRDMWFVSAAPINCVLLQSRQLRLQTPQFQHGLVGQIVGSIHIGQLTTNTLLVKAAAYFADSNHTKDDQKRSRCKRLALPALRGGRDNPSWQKINIHHDANETSCNRHAQWQIPLTVKPARLRGIVCGSTRIHLHPLKQLSAPTLQSAAELQIGGQLVGGFVADQYDFLWRRSTERDTVVAST